MTITRNFEVISSASWKTKVSLNRLTVRSVSCQSIDSSFLSVFLIFILEELSSIWSLGSALVTHIIFVDELWPLDQPMRIFFEEIIYLGDICWRYWYYPYLSSNPIFIRPEEQTSFQNCTQTIPKLHANIRQGKGSRYAWFVAWDPIGPNEGPLLKP